MEKVNIDGVDLYLSHPDELNLNWIGDSDELKQLLAAWMILDKDDIPLNPRILGKPGVGKTTLAYAAAKKISKEVYIFQCTMDTRPEDLIIQPIIGPNNTIEYHASPLLTAAIKGGVCILDEGNRMSEKAWASLAPLLDKRRYVESIIAGIKIKAHKDFRIAVTMNVDSSTFEIPEYIDSRLQPKIILDFPHAKEEINILKFNVPKAPDYLIRYVVSFLQDAHKADMEYSVRDGINILRYYLRLEAMEDSSVIRGDKYKELKENIIKSSKKKGAKLDNKSVNLVDRRKFEKVLIQILGEDALKLLNKMDQKRNRSDRGLFGLGGTDGKKPPSNGSGYFPDDNQYFQRKKKGNNNEFDELDDLLEDNVDYEDINIFDDNDEDRDYADDEEDRDYADDDEEHYSGSLEDLNNTRQYHNDYYNTKKLDLLDDDFFDEFSDIDENESEPQLDEDVNSANSFFIIDIDDREVNQNKGKAGLDFDLEIDDDFSVKRLEQEERFLRDIFSALRDKNNENRRNLEINENLSKIDNHVNHGDLPSNGRREDALYDNADISMGEDHNKKIEGQYLDADARFKYINDLKNKIKSNLKNLALEQRKKRDLNYGGTKIPTDKESRLNSKTPENKKIEKRN